jgi:hypothetical protein
MSETPSLPKALFDRTLHRLMDELALVEQPGENGIPFLDLQSQLPMVQGSIGNVRLFSGKGLFRVVTCSMVVAPMQLDSHMLFAFTPGDSAIPHFTLDSVSAGEHFAFHLDLIPRLDLGANLDYMKAAFAPLTEAYEKGSAVDGLSRAHLSPMQLAIMSPWMLANRATESAFADIEATVDAYQAHWLDLMRDGIADELHGGTSAAALQERNLRNKRIIFDPEIDAVWNRITPLIGAEAVAIQRALLIGEDE